MAILIVAMGTLVRLCLAAMLPLGVDEAYSIGIARQLSLSYFDHPPLHLWIVGGWARLIGSEDTLLLRLPFITLFALSGWLMFGLTRQVFGAAAALWAVAALNLTPVFGLAHGSWVLPDGPLIAAALGTAWVFSTIVFSPDRDDEALGRWALAGALAGLAMLSKYHGALLVAGMFAFLLSSPEHRIWLRRKGPWLAALNAAAVLSPVLIWNAGHDWASFRFQGGRGWGGTLQPGRFVQSIVLQSLYLLPWIMGPLAVVLVRGMGTGWRDSRRWFFVCVATPPIVIFTALTLFSNGLQHWQMPGWLFAFPLLGHALARTSLALRKALLVIAALTGVLLAGLGGVVAAQARWAVFDPLVRAVFGGSDPTDLVVRWNGIKDELARRGLPRDEKTFIAAVNWITAAQLNAVLGKDIPVLCLCADARHFAYLHPPADFAGWTGMVIDQPRRLEGASDALATMFDGLSGTDPLTIVKGDRVALTLGLRLGTGFRPPVSP